MTHQVTSKCPFSGKSSARSSCYFACRLTLFSRISLRDNLSSCVKKPKYVQVSSYTECLCCSALISLSIMTKNVSRKWSRAGWSVSSARVVRFSCRVSASGCGNVPSHHHRSDGITHGVNTPVNGGLADAKRFADHSVLESDPLDGNALSPA